MNLEWMLLANHAEDQGGLLYLSGATWDTVTVGAPTPAELPDIVALFQGYLVIRLLFHPTETGREHTFQVTVIDEDGHELQTFRGSLPVERNDKLLPGWDQGVHIILGLNGMPLPHFGNYEFSLQVDGQHLGDRPFRVVRGY